MTPSASELRPGAWRRLVAAAVLVAPVATASAADLVHIEIEAERAADGKPIDMEFHEIERTPELSRARVLTGAGGSASAAAILVLRGFCAVAESRGARFFYPRPLREAATPADALHTAEFADERAAVTPARLPGAAPAPAGGLPAGNASDGVFSIDDCRLAGFAR